MDRQSFRGLATEEEIRNDSFYREQHRARSLDDDIVVNGWRLEAPNILLEAEPPHGLLGLCDITLLSTV